MSLFIASLNSGSNGNCFYIGNNTESILVDAGISCREIEKRMDRSGLLMENVKGIFVSHEHSDHISGLSQVAKKFNLPVYITQTTLTNSRLCLDKQVIRSFTAFEPINIGSLAITAFPKFHDASDPYSFTISSNSVKIGVYTDIGRPCHNLVAQFSECHAAFLEANYDDKMLDSGSYPFYLKKRIRGGYGHLSNEQALDLFKAYRPPFMTHLFLSHLSKNNNCPDLLNNLFKNHSNGVKIIIAPRHEETAVYHITHPNSYPNINTRPKLASQLSFAFQ